MEKNQKVHVGTYIRQIRGQRVIIDSDLADLYGVSSKRLNEQVKRNHERFPLDFVFRLSKAEFENLKPQITTSGSGEDGMRSQFATASKRNIRHRPNAFTEHGAIMAANVLNSPKAVEMSVFVVRAFVKMREYLGATQAMEKRLAEIEKTLLVHDSSLVELFKAIRPLLLPPQEPVKRRIGFRTEDFRR